MSYDLVLRRQLPRDLSIGEETRPPRHRGALAAAAMLALLAPCALRTGEAASYRRRYGRDLARTQEVPVVGMRELVYGSGEEGR